MAILWVVIGAALVVLISLFHAQNPRDLNLFFFGYAAYGVPMWLLVTVPAVIGLGLGVLMSLPGRIRGAFAERKARGYVKDREKTIAEQQARITELEARLASAQTAAQRPVVPVVVEEAHRRPLDDAAIDAARDVSRAA